RADGRDSHEIVEQGLEVLRNLAHRGASGSDPETGDGAGLLLQVPDAFLRRACKRHGIDLPPAGCYGVGMLFLSPDPALRLACEGELERIAAEEGQRVLGWRDVPTEPGAIGAAARTVMPNIRQVFVARGAGLDDGAFERKLYVIRRRLHHVVEERYGGPGGCYVVSLSARTLVYKGLLRGPQVPLFYPDLTDAAVSSALALVHSRFSTNTLGSWQLAHPYRYVAHNGEINTLRGNVNWMRARESQLASPLFRGDIEKIRPIVEPRVSDSASFDNALELLVLGGRSLPHAIMTMIPEAWENDEGMDPDRRAFYQYHTSLMEPWDGPAAIAFTDGRLIGATLDRNGLRPARYSIARDGLVVLASEEGALPLPPEEVIARWRLQPGRMLLVDTVAGSVLGDEEAKGPIVRRRPYGRWIQKGTTSLAGLPAAPCPGEPEAASLLERQRAFGYTFEDLKVVLGPMASQGKEPDSSMGTDTPLAVLSERPQLLFSYFKQLFAQVTNPPIDPLREELVMSLGMTLGPESNLLAEGPEQCRRIVLDHPILSAGDLEKLRRLDTPPFRAATLPTLFPAGEGEGGMERVLRELCGRAEHAVEAHEATILILSDRGVDAEWAPIPSLLATAAIHHHLVRRGIRTRVGLVVETGEAREVHHIALLIGYGAVAVHPYLALETIAQLADARQLTGRSIGREEAQRNYVAAVKKGLLKIISKMGISTLFSYCGAQIFEAVGLDGNLVEQHFTGTASRIGGVGLRDLAREVLTRHGRAFDGAEPTLEIGGEYQLREQGEFHQWNPQTIASLQRAVQGNRFETFKDFTRHFDEQSARLATLRGLLELDRDDERAVPLAEVEPAEEIVKRFSTGAMSFGSLSREAHETLAIAMNRIGGKSNTGEGGEEPERLIPAPNGDSRRSAIKQVASARFGVTAHYLAHADVLQIKMAQGSKPGEGGQLPGHKVSEEIARVRHSTPGVSLISPPPHHDIYSIEDLAQLIHDLKNVNPDARVSVKLVSAVGVGTIAAGVAKAKADHITISGHDGGTGASPLSSIKHAGLPWELGLAETQQVLVQNGLRGRVRLQTDGHLKTGRDVVVAALLGAEEFAFATAPLVATGCIMMRACHLNTCPVGIATQNPELRKKFAGKPEHVINYFFFLAEEVRELMASLGFRRFEEMVGRADRLRLRRADGHPKARGLDLSALLARTGDSSAASGCSSAASGCGPLHQVELQDHALDRSPDNGLIRRCGGALDDRRPVQLGSPDEPLPIRNVDRCVGTMLSGQIVRRYGPQGLPEDTIRLTFRGTAGQSFGAWAAGGLTLVLQGETNDYAGKGLSGGTLVVAPPPGAGYEPERSVVVGNVALYGATGGEAYVRGIAGERFAV
ncbi:MAG: glutamate synthase large subunit, partial [Chloroflexi bacterium]|nr:glutamate synthase large subunit [Chloroflexota bacterium]